MAGKVRRGAYAAAVAATTCLLTACGALLPNVTHVQAQGDSAGGGSVGASGNAGRVGDSTEAFTMAFAGDANFQGRLASLLNTPDTALKDLAPPLASADLAMLNFEGALTTRGRPAGKPETFRSPPSALTALVGAGVDVMTMANNHPFDYGADGFTDTLAAKDDGPVAIVGVGVNSADAYAPHVAEAKGARVAILGSMQNPDWTTERHTATASSPGVASNLAGTRQLYDAVRAARGQADVVIVYLQWGTAGQPCPDRRQQETSRLLREAGAHVVVGVQSNRVQGAGWQGNGYVAYSLGNFLTSGVRGESAYTGVLTLTIDPTLASDPNRSVVTAQQWDPMRIGADGRPAAVPAAGRSAQDQAYQRAIRCSGLTTAAP